MSHLIVYRTAPNAEHRAAAELRDAGIKALVPRDRNGKRNPFTKAKPTIAPGYVFAAKAYRNAFAKHVKGALGAVTRAEIGRLYVKRKFAAGPSNPYAIGQAVLLGEVPATIASTNRAMCTIALTMLGKPHLQTLHYSRLRPGLTGVAELRHIPIQDAQRFVISAQPQAPGHPSSHPIQNCARVRCPAGARGRPTDQRRAI